MLLTTADIFFCQTDAKLGDDVLLSTGTSKQRRFSLVVFDSMLHKIDAEEVTLAKLMS